MSRQEFALQQFSLEPFSPQPIDLQLTGWIDRQNQQFTIQYRLSGAIDQIAIASPAEPIRKFELWEQTCFEFFVGAIGASNYWEFNLSPSGEWNVFHLEDYRQGLQEESAIESLPFSVERQDDSLVLTLEFDLAQLTTLKPTDAIEVSVTTVIQPKARAVSYWAIAHTGAEADFHRRDSFVIKA